MQKKNFLDRQIERNLKSILQSAKLYKNNI